MGRSEEKSGWVRQAHPAGPPEDHPNYSFKESSTNMTSRFTLTASGVAMATIGSTASADLISFTIHNDNYIGEDSWQLLDSASNTIASMYISGGYIFVGTSQSSTYPVSFGLWGSSAVVDGYRTTFQMDLAAGNYYVAMQDSWGDGWVWNSASGLDAFNVVGNIDGGSATFAFTTGNSAVGAFTVVPAPGALALLGLAGLGGRRRKRA